MSKASSIAIKELRARTKPKVNHPCAVESPRDRLLYRLRLSKSRWSDLYQFGIEMGQVWAWNKAEFFELESLNNYGYTMWKETFTSQSSYSAGAQFFFAVYPELDSKCVDARNFWKSQEDILGPNWERLASSMKFIDGFYCGVMEAWFEIDQEIGQ